MADFIDAIRKIGGTKFASYDDEGSTLVTGGLYWDIGRYAKEVEDNANEVSINTTTVTNLANEVDEKHTFVVDVKTNLVGSDGSYSNPSSGSVYRDIITKQTEVGTWYTALSSYSDQIQTVGNDLANGVNSYIIKVSDNIGYVGTVGTNLNKEENSDIVIVSNDLTGNKYIQTVVSKLGDVSKVADVSSYVPTVANINSEITEVARLNQQVEEVGSDLLKGSNSHISGLYNKMYIMEELYGTFGTTSTALGNIQTVATDLGLDADDDEATHSSINTVSYNINKVQGVFNALTPIQAVYDIKDSIEEIGTGTSPTGVPNITSIQLVAEDLDCSCTGSYIKKVATIDDEVKTVAGLEAPILQLSNASSGLVYLAANAPALVTVKDNLDELLDARTGANYAYDEYVYDNLTYDLTLENLPIEINNSNISYDKHNSQVILYLNRERLNKSAYTIDTEAGTFSVIDPTTGNPYVVSAGSNIIVGVEVFDLIQLKNIVSTDTMEAYQTEVQMQLDEHKDVVQVQIDEQVQIQEQLQADVQSQMQEQVSMIEQLQVQVEEQIKEMDKNTYRGFFPLAIGVLDGFTTNSNNITLYPNIPNKYVSAHINDMTNVLDLDNVPEVLYPTSIGVL
jgi:hypothetical protein